MDYNWLVAIKTTLQNNVLVTNAVVYGTRENEQWVHEAVSDYFHMGSWYSRYRSAFPHYIKYEREVFGLLL